MKECSGVFRIIRLVVVVHQGVDSDTLSLFPTAHHSTGEKHRDRQTTVMVLKESPDVRQRSQNRYPSRVQEEASKSRNNQTLGWGATPWSQKRFEG